MWYCRHEIQLRQALFFSAASVAGAFSGILAFGISKMDGVGGLAGWRWIFILEGIATVLVAACAFFFLHDFPETAKFLTEEERAFVIYRLKYQGQVQISSDGETEQAHVAQAEEFEWKYVLQAFTDWQVWVNIFVYWSVSLPPFCPFYRVAFFHLFACNADSFNGKTRSCVPSTASPSFCPPSSSLSTTHRALHS